MNKLLSQKNRTLVGIGIGLVSLGLLLAIWLLLDTRAGKPPKPAALGVKVTSLQSDSEILAEYRDYHFLVKEDWIKAAGFDLHKRLYPAQDPSGVIRFKPPTEYFEVGLSSDSDKGVTNLNIVGVSIRASGVTETVSSSKIDELFAKGTLPDDYDEVRTEADGRVKAQIASHGCLVQASGYEKEKVRKLVDILFTNCAEALKKS